LACSTPVECFPSSANPSEMIALYVGSAVLVTLLIIGVIGYLLDRSA
jgi:hypothetical protein